MNTEPRENAPRKCPTCRTPMTVTYSNGEQIITCPQCAATITFEERVIMAYDRATNRGFFKTVN